MTEQVRLPTLTTPLLLGAEVLASPKRPGYGRSQSFGRGAGPWGRRRDAEVIAAAQYLRIVGLFNSH